MDVRLLKLTEKDWLSLRKTSFISQILLGFLLILIETYSCSKIILYFVFLFSVLFLCTIILLTFANLLKTVWLLTTIFVQSLPFFSGWKISYRSCLDILGVHWKWWKFSRKIPPAYTPINFSSICLYFVQIGVLNCGRRFTLWKSNSLRKSE